MNFKLKNIIKEPKSTAVGLSILVACFVLPLVSEDLSFKDTLPVLAMVVPFLLWGGGPKPPEGGQSSQTGQSGLLTSMVLVFLLVACDPMSLGKNEKRIAETKQKIDRLSHQADHLDSLYFVLERRESILINHYNKSLKTYEEYYTDTLPSLEHLLSRSRSE